MMITQAGIQALRRAARTVIDPYREELFEAHSDASDLRRRPLILLLGTLRAAVGLVCSWVLLHMGTSLNLPWVSNVTEHLLRLPMEFFEMRHIGDIVSRFGAINAIPQTLTTSAIEGLFDGLMAITTLVMMLVYSPFLASTSVAAVVAYGVFRLIRHDVLLKVITNSVFLRRRRLECRTRRASASG